MKDNVQYYNEIHPFIYGMQGRHNNNGKLVSHWGSKNKLARIKELRELNPSIKIIPTIFRWENKGEKISENIGMNGRKDIRDLHIKYILEEVDTYNYDGIDIDYEGMTCDKKEKFEEFIVILSKELKKRNKILSVAVHPKTPSKYTRTKNCKGKNLKMDFQENWRGPLTHDYKFLGKYADRVKIMAYELHPRKYHNPGPGPQGPNVWLENIIEYAITRVPNKKLFMAIPTYGYDWALNCKSRAKAVYYSTALKIQSKKHKFYQPTDVEEIFNRHAGRSKSWRNMGKFMDIHRDKVYEDPSLWYTEGGCDRVAFFMNRKAFEKKMELLRSYNLAGFSFWQLLSDNDPGINKYLSLLLTNQVPPIPIAERKIEMLENREREKIASAQEPKKKGNREKKQIKN
ncbi:MAG: hydrolase [Leptospiraceae bacterium]|nr:hydrolase [Leptospiraceae bacterium]